MNGDNMSKLIEIRVEDKNGNTLCLNEVNVSKRGGIEGNYKKGKEVNDCVIYFDKFINYDGLCSKRFKYNFLFDEYIDFHFAQRFKIGDVEFEVVKIKECFNECNLLKNNMDCNIRNAVFVKSLDDGIIKIGDIIKK